MMSSMKILITGSNGFLGQNLISLIKQKYSHWKITGIDNNPKSAHEYNFIQIDFQSSVDWNKYLGDITPDYIIHAVGVFRTNNNNMMFQVNTSGFFQFIEAIRLSEYNPKMIVIGSSAEYRLPKQDENPIDENYPLSPASLYGLTKKWQEEIGLYYNKTYGMNIICTRPSNFIGKGISSQLLPGYLANLFKQNKTEIPIKISSLNTVRDYIDVRDVCDALLGLLNCSKCKNEIFNISSSIGVTNEELIRVFEEVTEKKAIIESQNCDSNSIVLSNKKLEKLINWSNNFSLKESVNWCL